MKRKSIALTLLLGLGSSLITFTYMVGGPYTTVANSYAPSQATPTLSINDVSLVEGNTRTSSMVFTVTLTAAGARPTIGVAYDTADGPPPSGATAPQDYTRVSNFLTFPSGTGTTTMTISVPIIGDTAVEPDETFLVNLSRADGATITDAQGVGTIINDDAPTLPTLSVSDASLVEGNAGTNFMAFTVSLTATGSWSNIVCFYETADRMPPSATEGSDYTSASGFLNFSQGTGNATMTFSVPISGDTTIEPDETFLVSLLLEIGATVTRRQGVGTIVNDDDVPPVLALSINDVSAAEGNIGTTNAVFTVSISAPSASAVRVDYVTADGTATVADNDYTSRSGTVTFPAGDGSPRTIAVPIIGDTRNEPNQNFSVLLVNAVNATIADSIGECTIINDDSSSLPELSIYNGARVEGNPDPTVPGGGGGTVFLTVFLSNRSSSDIRVDYTAVDGTATLADNDYTNPSGTLTIPAGLFGQPIAIPIVADRKIETDEFFFVNLSNAVGATITVGQARCTIISDDCAYSINPTSQTIPSTGSTGNRVGVTAEPDNSDCEWTAVSNDPWIHVDEDGSGTDTIHYVVDRNPGSARTGTITVAGQTFTVNQNSTCPASAYAISPIAGTADSDGGAGSITITAPGNCAWTATPTVSWIHLGDDVETTTTSVDGQGNGKISYSVETNDGPFRSGAITINGEIQHTVNQDANGCPLGLICALFPGVCVGSGANALSEARTFRDKVLATTPRGVAYTHLYYQFSAETVQIMMLNPMLILRSREVMERYMPVIQSMASGEQVTLTTTDLDDIQNFLESFAQKGTPALRESVKALCEDLHNPQVHVEFNITITDDPKLESRPRDAVQTFNQTGMMAPIGLLLFCLYRIRPRRKKQTLR